MNGKKEDFIDHPIAKDIMTPYVHMLPSIAKFKDLLELMYEKRVSAIIIYKMDKEIKNPKKNYYIISQTDIVDYLFKNKNCDDIYEVPLSEIMKGPINMVDQETPIDLVIRIMTEKGYKRVLISKNDEPVGVVSTKDVLMWNNLYFKPSKPILLMVIDNKSSILLGQYIFRENIEQNPDRNIIELYGGALSSISNIADEIVQHSGQMKVLQKENATILLEPKNDVTGILICDNNSIELRERLHEFIERFVEEYNLILNSKTYKVTKPNIDLSNLIGIFGPIKNK